jgi:hypothetical protein
MGKQRDRQIEDRTGKNSWKERRKERKEKE